MTNIKSPKTKKAIQRSSDAATEKRKSSLLPSSSSESPRAKKPKRLSNVEVSNLMVKENISKEVELMRLALARAQNREPDLQGYQLVLEKVKVISQRLLTSYKNCRFATHTVCSEY